MASKPHGHRTHSFPDESASSPTARHSKHRQSPKPQSKSKAASPLPSPSSHHLQPAGRSPPPADETYPWKPSLAASDHSFLVLDDPSPPGAASHNRDSIVSIAEDPFFQRYATPPGDLHGPSPPTVPDVWPPPRRESLTLNPLIAHTVAAAAPMEAVNVAVIGANGVGKSSFIQRALRLSRPLGSNITPVRVDLDGLPLLVTLIEIDLEYFEVEPGQPVRWPKQVGGHMLPRIDSSLVLYDVTDKESIRDLPPTMAALAVTNIPTILVATKCDSPDNLRQLNVDAVPGVFPAVIAEFRTSANLPGTTRECLQAIIRAALTSKRDKSEAAISRRRAASSAAHLEAPDNINGRPLSQHSKHSRASSDLSLLRGLPPPSTNEGYSYRGQARSPRMEYSTTQHLASSHFTSEVPADNAGVTVSSMLRTHGGVRLDTGTDSFLDVDESDVDSYRRDSDDIPILQRNDENYADKPAKMVGVSFDDLVDRLLAPRMTRADNNFADIFLCLYRKFAAPGELFSAILARQDSVKDEKGTRSLLGVQTRLRIIEVIAKWVSLYPGDFARSTTRRMLDDLVRNLSAEPIYMAAAHQMRWYLDHSIMEDDDTGWAKSDEPDEEPAEPQGRRLSATKDLLARGSGGSGASGLSDSMSSLQLQETRASDSEEKNGAHFQFHSLEDYEQEAATMVPTSTLPLNKIRYHIFLDKDTDDIADEITRIDWIMFSSIRIRDLVRHVSLPMDQKERCRSLENVNRMISHFNHVAHWVSNMILIRDKAKHRAPCLEKFMLIALRLRVLNNYNGLAAVLAGINGTSIHRLVQTRALVSTEVQKRFARLGLLMGTQKSHFAYRLAWENSPLPRIPFMPLHRRDLVSAEEGSRTFVGPRGDRINWKKFEVLGEVLLPLMKSQGTPYPNLRRDDGSRELILDCKMPTDEEEIYQRSILVEPSSGMGESSRKKFPWLAK